MHRHDHRLFKEDYRREEVWGADCGSRVERYVAVAERAHLKRSGQKSSMGATC